MTYEKVVENILEIPKFTKKNSLSHTREFLRRLGEPQKSFSIIHIAGSNGKGSVCAYLNSIFQKCGIATGMFTSPHLIDIRERFLICGSMCTKEDFLMAEEKVRKVVEDMKKEELSHPSFFEYLFAIAMILFQEKKLSYVILETGLGGRLDATNIVENPLLTIITSLSLEHTEILGNTIQEIAIEKAGIMKPYVPVIVDGTNKDALVVLEEIAEKNHVPMKVMDYQKIHIFHKKEGMIEFSITNEKDFQRIRIHTFGEYQVMNAALAWSAANYLKKHILFSLTEDTIAEGLESMKWPGRMEEILPEIYIDGAHNPAGIQGFLQSVKEMIQESPILLFSMVQEKNYQEVIHLLCENRLFDKIILTEISHNKRSLSLDDMKQNFLKEGYQEEQIFAIKNSKDALKRAIEVRDISQKIFCAGSLYLIGELKKEVGGFYD